MKLITRLILLVSTTALLFSAAIAVYFVVLSPIDTIQAEHGYFAAANTAVTDLQIQLGRLLTDTFGNQKPAYEKSLAAYYAAIEDVGTKVVLLPRMNKGMADAVETIKQLRQASEISLSTLESNWKLLEEDAKTIFADSSGAYIMKFFGHMAKRTKPELLDPAQFHVFDLQDTMQNLTSFLSATAQTIRDKDSAVASEIAKIRGQSMQFKAVRCLMRNISVMASGDLTFRFAVKNRDEIGLLGQDLNQMLEMLDASIILIQEAAHKNLGIRKELVQAVTEATSSAVEVEANSNSIRTQMEHMDRMIESSSSDVNRVSLLITTFNKHMSVQKNNVSESVAAVTQILASIENIARITELNQQTTETLVKESDRGRTVFEDAFGRVTEISESVHAIKEMAAASAASSEEIAQTIKDVVVKFNEAASTKDNTITTFGQISTRIREVTDSVDEIYANVSEMRAGSRQVLEATRQLRNSSSEITGESGKINADIGAVQDAIAEISRVSREVVSNISEISIGLHDITHEIHVVSARTEQLTEIGDSLDDAVNKFKTGKQGEAAAAAN